MTRMEVAKLFFILGLASSAPGFILTAVSLVMNLRRTRHGKTWKRWWAPREALTPAEAAVNRLGFAFMVIGLFDLLVAITLLHRILDE